MRSSTPAAGRPVIWAAHDGRHHGPGPSRLSVGIALASTPGPVQAVLLAESVSGGIARGFRAQAGANLTFAALLAALALGLSLAAPAGLTLAALQMAGGALLLWLAADGLRSAPATGAWPGWLPGLPRAARGVLAVLLNPGSWLFLGAVAAPLAAAASQRGSTGGALVVALVTVMGCGSGDTAVVLIGGAGVRRVSARARQWVHRALAVLLGGLGAWFLAAGIIKLART